MAPAHQTNASTCKYTTKFVATALCLLVLHCITSHAARFLIALGPDKGSLLFTTIAIGDALIERGHNVTLLVDEIIVDQAKSFNAKFELEIFKSTVTEAEVNKLEGYTTAIALTGHGLMAGFNYSTEVVDGVFYRQCRDLLAQSNVIDRIQRSNFHLVLASLAHICPVLVAKHVDVPFVALFQSFISLTFGHAHHHPFNAAYMPPAYSGWSDRMPFYQRLFSALFSILNWPNFLTAPLGFPNFHALKNQYNISPDKSLFRIMDDAELWFLNSHFTLEYPHPMNPDTIALGGLTTKPAKSLEKNLESFVESSGDEGVIIFSMGSVIKGVPADHPLNNIIADAFAQLPQKVIWKLGGASSMKVPENVMLTKWLPQNDLLGHPKTKILVHHCGVNGVFEALYHAVPMLCIPMFGDHFDAAARIVSRRIGIQIDVNDLTSEGLVNAVQTLLTDSSYRDNIQHLSSIFRDEPLTPSHRGAYWMEYIVRHGDAKHLRSAAHDLSFIQYHLIDVIVVLLLTTALIIWLTFWCCKATCKCCCRTFCHQKIKRD